MPDISPPLQAALAESAHYEFVSSHLSALLSSYPPPFIFIHDPETPRLTASVVRSALQSLASKPLVADTEPCQLKHACINAVACFSGRIFYDTALNALAEWTPDWRDGATNWHGSGAEARRFNENFDAFVHGIQALVTEATAAADGSTKANGAAKGKGKERERAAPPNCRLVLVVERAERLKDNLPELLVPLTRLAELTQVDITTVFISEVQWQDVRPPLRTSPEPYYIDVPFLSKQATQDLLASAFPSPSAGSSSSAVDPDAYHPALKPLYADFIAIVYSTCAPFTHDPTELAYIAAARWPGFVQPVLDAYRSLLTEEEIASTPRDEEGDDGDQRELQCPTEDTRLRLLRLFTPSLTAALESLYPRLSNATHWARVHAPPPDLLSMPPGAAPNALAAQVAANAARLNAQHDRPTDAGIDALPRMAKFVLVAAFLASTNPARSDLRMFGRGLDERAKRRRRKGGTPRRPKPGTAGTAVKIPQRLLGPTAFPLDRLVAILGVLLEENDADVRPVAPQYTLPGEYTEMEIARVALYANIVELGSMRLLVRTTPPDHLDRVPMYKCGIGYELAIKLAKSLGIILNDLVYEVV
ncbi:origin recognition complex subunit 5 C-terminus-domain-containing protein [Cerioporus squamosus]|nr:origin recognition complex subunit 5 C-terminus-domain-containing protein [Cerioporus squamosus]